MKAKANNLILTDIGIDFGKIHDNAVLLRDGDTRISNLGDLFLLLRKTCMSQRMNEH